MMARKGTEIAIGRRGVLVGAAGSAFAVGILGSRGAVAQTVTMRIGSDSPIEDEHSVSAIKMKEIIEAKTGGRIKISIFPNGQIGDNEVMMNGVKAGTLDAVQTDLGTLSQAVPAVSVFSLPFLFKDTPHALRGAQGSVGAKLQPMIEKAFTCQVMGWGTDGLRNMWNSKRPIRTPEDVKGLKMRVQANPVHKETFTVLGALATPVPFPELYGALQTGVVDGADTSVVDMLSIKFYQVTKYLSLTKHFSILGALVVSDKFLAKLSEADRAIVREAARIGSEAQVEATLKGEAKGVAELKAKGIEIIDGIDLAAFAAKMGPVYELGAKTIGQPLIDEARGIA
jgi:tripartite ATP-independent transporter DctP family solute receptor